jgi:hypothetical protein
MKYDVRLLEACLCSVVPLPSARLDYLVLPIKFAAHSTVATSTLGTRTVSKNEVNALRIHSFSSRGFIDISLESIIHFISLPPHLVSHILVTSFWTSLHLTSPTSHISHLGHIILDDLIQSKISRSSPAARGKVRAREMER